MCQVNARLNVPTVQTVLLLEGQLTEREGKKRCNPCSLYQLSISYSDQNTFYLGLSHVCQSYKCCQIFLSVIDVFIYIDTYITAQAFRGLSFNPRLSERISSMCCLYTSPCYPWSLQFQRRQQIYQHLGSDLDLEILKQEAFMGGCWQPEHTCRTGYYRQHRINSNRKLIRITFQLAKVRW